VDEIVIGHRTAPRILAILPAAVVTVAVRSLTVLHPSVPVRVAAAAGVALAGWCAYRLLTARVVVAESGVHVRGVLYDADIAWTELDQATLTPASRPLQFLLLGILRPYSLALRAGVRTLRPIAAISSDDDVDLRRAVRAIEMRAGTWRLPSQRTPEEPVTSV
jgi:hypothetical protein